MHPIDIEGTEIFRELLEEKSQYLFEKAEQITDEFHKVRKEYIQYSKGKNKPFRSPHLGCRVRRNPRSLGISIEWFRYEYAGAKGNRKVYSTYLKLPKTRAYNEDKVFDWRTLDWEKKMFQQLEPQFAELRQHSFNLGILSKNVSRYTNAIRALGVLGSENSFE